MTMEDVCRLREEGRLDLRGDLLLERRWNGFVGEALYNRGVLQKWRSDGGQWHRVIAFRRNALKPKSTRAGWPLFL